MEEWTNEEVQELYAHLAERCQAMQRGELTKTAWKKLQTAAGWNYANGASLLSSPMAARANLPRGVFYDWMHSMVSSGGVAQYEINQLLKRIASLSSDPDATFDNMEDIRAQVKWPKTSPRFPSLRLKDRMSKKENGHVRMFASEALHTVVFLGIYCQLVLIPSRLLSDEVECFVLLGRILYLLRGGAAAVDKVDLLGRLLLEHHDKFLALYPQSAKIKVHLLLHIPSQFEYHGVNLSCFATERKHKASKAVAAYAFRQWCKTMMNRTLLSTFKDMAEPDALESYALLKAAAIDWPRLIAEGCLALMDRGFSQEGQGLKTPSGQVWKKDLVAFRTADGFGVGFVKHLFKASEGRFLAHVDRLYRHTEAIYDTSLRTLRRCLVPAECLHGAFPYLPLDDTNIWLVASSDTLCSA